MHLILPIAELMQRELRKKLDAPDLKIDLSSLGATDTMGKARALQSMVGAGVPLDEARRLAGLQ